MAQLSYPSATEVQLRLEAQEDAILAVIRGCPWWTKAEVEGRLPGSTIVSGVILTTTRGVESTLRRILQLSFGMVFPAEGGVAHQVRQAAPVTAGRKARLPR
ncbi:MAG: hypothetical protein M3R24_28790 [Chloroflexota bacterium]|nr:hypothetical protein [Chloroflexota bacterium]PLS77786.1 MAG: hypothetical protein CYG59_21970 [Chloroflexota bacterium]